MKLDRSLLVENSLRAPHGEILPGSAVNVLAHPGDGNEADAVVFKDLGVIQAAHQGAAGPVQLADQQASKLPCLGVGPEAVRSWAAGLGAADGVLVDSYDPLALAV